MLVLLLLDVHGAQVLGQELLDLGYALLHGLKLDGALLVELEGFGVVLEAGHNLGPARRLVPREHLEEGAVVADHLLSYRTVSLGAHETQTRGVPEVLLHTGVPFAISYLLLAYSANKRLVHTLLVGRLWDRLPQCVQLFISNLQLISLLGEVFLSSS